MVNPKTEPHPAAPSPFDDDESSHSDGDARNSLGWFAKWIRPSGTVAAVSLGVAIIGSVVSNNAAGDRNIEDLAYSVNRFAGIVMLLACFGLLLGFRGDQIVELFSRARASRASTHPNSGDQSPTLSLLFLRSIVFSVALAIAVALLVFVSGVEVAMIAMISFYSLYFPVLVTAAAMRTGTARAYSIGMVANFLFLLVGYFGIFGLVLFQAMFWGPGGGFGQMSYYMAFWRKVMPVIVVCGTQALMILSGLICAWYANALTPNNAIQAGSPVLTTLPPPPASVDRTEASA